MMAVKDVGPIGGAFYAAHAADLDRSRPAPFRARAGRVKRLMRLARDIRETPSVRGKLSLLYVRLRADSRVRDLQRWSDIGRGAPVSQDDMRQLVDRVTRKCPGTANSRVFRRVAERYCEKAGTEQLAALRRRLVTATRDAGDWLGGVPRKDAARVAWETLGAMLDGELARRTLVLPLKQLAQALPAGADSHELDLACARLAAILHRITEEGTGHGLLAAALEQLTHAEFQLLAQQLAPAGVSPGDAGRARCPLAQALGGPRSSPEVWERRLALIGKLQDAMSQAVGQRLDYFVDTTSKLIDFHLDRGRHGQEVYDLAAESLTKSLQAVAYAGVLAPGGDDTLVPRLIAAALMGKPLKDVLAFVGKLSIQALTTLAGAMDDATADYAGAAWLIRGVRDDRVQPYRDSLADRLGNLKQCLDGGERWPIVRALGELGLALQAWESGGPCAGQRISQSVEQDLHTTVQRALERVFRGAWNPSGTLDYACIAVLSDDEVECLRKQESCLRKYGLSLDKDALETIACERGAPYVAASLEPLIALADSLAQKEARADRIMRALREGVEPLATACAKYACFVDMTAEDTMRLCTEVASAAWRDFTDRHPERRADARAGMAASGHILANGLDDAASCLVQGGRDDATDDPPSLDPATHAAWRLRLSSRLMESLVAASAPGAEDATRDATGVAFTSPWTAALSTAVTEQFGVRYDAVNGRADLVMTRAHHRHAAEVILRREMTTDRLVHHRIAGAPEPMVVAVDRQFVLDGIDRTTTQFSITGVDPFGRYIPLTSSAQAEGDETHLQGVERALDAFHRAAGPDTAPLSTYMVQTMAAEFLMGLFELGTAAPIQLDDGRPVLPGGGGGMRTDLTRLADGSYVLKIKVSWDRLVSVTAFNGAGVKLDAEQSYASMACDIHLARMPEGGWRREIISPIAVSYHLARLVDAEEV